MPGKKEKLTTVQKKVLAFIKSEIKQHGRPPTLQEMAEHFGWKSHNSAYEHLLNLERKGAVVLEPNIARNVTLCA